jgi:hypothetical protein
VAEAWSDKTMDTRPPIPANPWKLSGKASNLQVKHSFKLHFALQLVIPAAILPAIAVGMITGYLEKWLWMGQLHYTGIF